MSDRFVPLGPNTDAVRRIVYAEVARRIAAMFPELPDDPFDLSDWNSK